MNPLSASYFQRLQQALANAGLAEPVLVIDRDRLDTNIAALKAMLPEGMAYRIFQQILSKAFHEPTSFVLQLFGLYQ